MTKSNEIHEYKYKSTLTIRVWKVGRGQKPGWVNELIESGHLVRIPGGYKFKNRIFAHGTYVDYVLNRQFLVLNSLGRLYVMKELPDETEWELIS